MAKLHKVSVGGELFHARSGQLLLDAALANGIEFPHDCRAGRCGSCLARVRQGITLGGEGMQPGFVHACQARVFSDIQLEIEPLPPVARVKGRIVDLTELAEDIVEVTIALEHALDMMAGQYCRFAFRGFPARPFSPTVALTPIAGDGCIRLNIKRVREGRVTSQLGQGICSGHAVAIEGPFGHAYFRPGKDDRLVLIGSGTGFAPVWAIAAAALSENPLRTICLIGASRKGAAFYMAPALELASQFANVSIVAAIEELRGTHGRVVGGPVVEHLPDLAATDIVYAAGAPAMVEAVSGKARAVGATFYADPFEPMAPPAPGWLDLAKSWLQAS